MKTICIDFDGVIYPNFRYLSVDDIRGEPIPGTIEALNELSKTFNIVVHSSRCEIDKGIVAIELYLQKYGMYYEVVKTKPVAHIYIDDRAVCFNGDWDDTINAIESFKQWQRDDKLKARILRKKQRRR